MIKKIKKKRRKNVKKMKIKFELDKFFLQSLGNFFFFFIYRESEELENIDLPRKNFEIWFSRKSILASFLKIIEYCFWAQNFV